MHHSFDMDPRTPTSGMRSRAASRRSPCPPASSEPPLPHFAPALRTLERQLQSMRDGGDPDVPLMAEVLATLDSELSWVAGVDESVAAQHVDCAEPSVRALLHAAPDEIERVARFGAELEVCLERVLSDGLADREEVVRLGRRFVEPLRRITDRAPAGRA